MPETSVHPSDRWATLASSNATPDDASYPPAPIVYLWGPFFAFVGLFIVGVNIKDVPTRISAMAGSVIAGIVIYVLVTRWSYKQWDMRARSGYVWALDWLSSRVGDVLTIEIADALSDPGAFTGWVSSLDSVSCRVDDETLAELIVATASARAWMIPSTIRTQCHPRTTHGWTTDDHACDVTPNAVRAMLASGDVTSAGYRAELRRQLCPA